MDDILLISVSFRGTSQDLRYTLLFYTIQFSISGTFREFSVVNLQAINCHYGRKKWVAQSIHFLI